MWVRSLSWEDSQEESMAAHSSILTWRIPWTGAPGGLQSMGSQRVRYDWSDLACTLAQYFYEISVNTVETETQGDYMNCWGFSTSQSLGWNPDFFQSFCLLLISMVLNSAGHCSSTFSPSLTPTSLTIPSLQVLAFCPSACFLNVVILQDSVVNLLF